MFEVIRWVSIVLLWICIALNIGTLILNVRSFRKWQKRYNEVSLEYFDNLFKKFEDEFTGPEEYKS